jgi:hypothetical protein
MIHFGSPRVGNENFAKFVDQKIPTKMRHTHRKDIVVHNPSELFPFDFYHISNEIFEDKNGVYNTCSGGEDKHCADQYSVDVSISDHLVYLDHCIGSGCGQCHAKGMAVQTSFPWDPSQTEGSFLQ